MYTTSIRRPRPAKPVRTEAVEKINLTSTGTKSFDTKTSLAILKAFYIEVRNELKKNDSALVTANTEADKCSLSFICDGFNLSFNYTEGGQQ